MNIIEKKNIIKEQEVITGKKCDYCGNDIIVWDFTKGNVYYSITTCHHDWGNDSFESIENKDACSLSCVQKAMDEYYKQESDTRYIEIECERLSLNYKEV